MTWTVKLANEGAKQLKKLPRDHQALLRRRLQEMSEDPFQGDVKPLKGKQWVGRYRKRAGRYRLIFTVSHQTRSVEVSAILLRSEKTYL